MKIFWQFVIPATLIMYVMIILSLPFSSILATFFLLALIGFWSRLPGVGIPHPLWILYNLDLVDVITVVIAINLGGMPAAILSVFLNLYTRACGVFPDWRLVISDAVSMFIAAILTPYFHVLFGSNILVTMTIFTLIRAVMWTPVDIVLGVFHEAGIVRYAVEWIVGVITLLFINGVYMGIFGGLFGSLLEGKMEFSWILFLIITAIIFVFYMATYKRNSDNESPSLSKTIFKRLFGKKKKKTLHMPEHIRTDRPMFTQEHTRNKRQ